MKKKIYLFLATFIIFLTGCELSNNPNSKVEELLGNYQRLDNTINISYTDLITDINLTDNQKERYTKIIEEQYENMSYEIKNEEIDGEEAIITTQIEVKNYKDIINKYNINNYEQEEYHNLILDDLESTKEIVTYTIEFKVTKINDEWKLNELDQEQKQKLLGIY